jgi:hypothetical protein
MSRHRNLDNLPTQEPQNGQYMQLFECDRGRAQEVNRGDLAEVILNKGLPALRRPRGCPTMYFETVDWATESPCI